MPPMSFLPTFPTALNLLTAAGLILIVGIMGARLVTRMLPVPTITGYVLTGLLIGPAGLNLIDIALLDKLGLLVDLGLGLILFELGRRVDYRWLLREKRLLATGIAISLSTFFALYLLLTFFGTGKLLASMIGAIGMATSPAVVLNVVSEVKAEGQLTERMLNIVVIGNALAFVGFSMGLSALHLEYQAGWHSYLLHPLYLFFGSALLGWLASRVLIWAGQWIGRDSRAQLILMLALIASTVGIAAIFKLSALIALLAFGIAGRSRPSSHIVIEPDISQFSALLYVLLFVFAGTRLEWVHLRDLAPVALAFIAVRLAMTTLLTTALAPANGLTIRKGALLGLGLLPLSGFKIILVQQAASLYPQFGNQLSALMTSIIFILEIAGPICTRYALVAAGEAKT
ncbi:MAG: putative Na/H+ antiporter [Herminiimonas sp.]|nr:putative Na/H+ antiporter [Herminiimonas sp.]